MVASQPAGRFFLPVAALCLCVLQASSGAAGSLTVQVVGCKPDRDGLAGVSVTVTPVPPPVAGASPGGALVTNNDGIVRLAAAAGAYTVTVACPGGATFTKRVYNHPQFGHELNLVVECCRTAANELDYWEHDPSSGGNWEQSWLLSNPEEKDEWDREFGDLHVRLIDCNGNPHPLAFQARLARVKPNPRAFAPARQAGAGGAAVYERLSLGTYDVSVVCPPAGPPVSATATLRANTTSTVTFKCPASTCSTLTARQVGWVETIEVERTPGGRTYRSAPGARRAPVEVGEADRPAGSDTRVVRTTDAVTGLETVTMAAAGRTIDLHLPPRWQASNEVLITVVEREDAPTGREGTPAAAAGGVGGFVVDVGGERVSVGRQATPLVIAGAALRVAGALVLHDRAGQVVAHAELPIAPSGAPWLKPARVPRIAQRGGRLWLPGDGPPGTRSYLVGIGEAPAGAPVTVLAATDDLAVLELPKDLVGPARIVQARPGGVANEFPVHVLGVDVTLDAGQTETVIQRGGTRKMRALLSGTQGLDRTLRETGAELVAVTSGGVRISPARVPIRSGRDAYDFTLTGALVGRFNVRVLILERPR